jgi:hypothetical protein
MQSTSESEMSGSDQPSWFANPHRLMADSTSYTLNATVIHSDSTKAISLAKESARAYLMTELDAQNEEMRVQLVRDQELDALSSAPFILQLRRFTSYTDDIKFSQSTATARPQGYQAFVQVSLSKASYRSQLRTFLDRATTDANRDAWMDILKN